MSRFISRSRRSAALAFAVALAAAAARADEAWTALYRDDGVSVSERAVDGRVLPDFRGEVEIPADPFDVLAVILDVPAQTEWMWQCRESRVLGTESDSVKIVYQMLDAHWPATDRDVVFRSETQLPEPGRIRVHFTNQDDPRAPPVAELVRMARLDGEFDLVALDTERTQVIFTVAADPGGSLPAMIVNRTVRESPFDTLVGLRRRVAEMKGHYADVVATWRARAPAAR